jgi:hypothetical protein
VGRRAIPCASDMAPWYEECAAKPQAEETTALAAPGQFRAGAI